MDISTLIKNPKVLAVVAAVLALFGITFFTTGETSQQADFRNSSGNTQNVDNSRNITTDVNEGNMQQEQDVSQSVNVSQ